ncbi:hypothetical protein [Clostridium tertium]
MYYTSFKSKRCSKEVILLTEQLNSTLKVGKYISCSHCGSRNVFKETETDDFREVMKARRYKRNSHGALEQI